MLEGDLNTGPLDGAIKKITTQFYAMHKIRSDTGMQKNGAYIDKIISLLHVQGIKVI